jgi:hypothetical protein
MGVGDMSDSLRPFWQYYGGKWRDAVHYEPPKHGVIVEPFAGAAGYSCRYPDRDVVLVDASPVVAGIWRWLISASPDDILSIGDIPEGGTVDDLDAPQEARWLAGFWCNLGAAHPRKRPSRWSLMPENQGQAKAWGAKVRTRIATQVPRIRHWQVIEGDYTAAPNVAATWFIDPPYRGRAGKHYRHQPGDFDALGAWCRTRQGQVMVCEGPGADWLPFKLMRVSQNATNPKRAKWGEEWIWQCDDTAPPEGRAT